MTTHRIPFLETSPIYKPSDIAVVLEKSVNNAMTVGNNSGVYYYNVPCSFDIETSSFYLDENGKQIGWPEKQRHLQTDPAYNPTKRAIMYVWQFGINGNVIVGRTWEEFVIMCAEMARLLRLDEKRRLMCFVHNLDYEFQFMCRWFEWDKVFSIDLRKPLYALTKSGIEFRCSYKLTGYSLANLGKQLQRHKVQKMTGDLDYSLCRHSMTPLTEKEMGYCVNDVRVVMAYIQEQIENKGEITRLPLTKTGNVRNFCRSRTLYIRAGKSGRKRNMNYLRLIHDLNIADMAEFNLLQRAFQGGFTHANAYHMGEVCEKVASYDFTSSYPYVMLSEKFPMSKGVRIELNGSKEFYRYINDPKYLCVFDIGFADLLLKETNENYISESKCWKLVDPVTNNGRIAAAKLLETTMTSVDFPIVSQYYSWSNMVVTNFYVYTADYLPRQLLECILDLYEQKTVLKDVKGKEVEYQQSKEMINSVYGMSVTNPLRDEFVFDGENWEVFTANPVEAFEMLQQHNESINRFLYYIWGIFVTAYARRNLFTAIYEMGDDYVYSDTDSVKIFNHEAHRAYFEAYDKIVDAKLHKVCEVRKLDFKKVEPHTIEGKVKKLGVWDFEGEYVKFKTLGAKRYMVQHSDTARKKWLTGVDGVEYPISITVSGVNKKNAVPFLWRLADGDVDAAFDLFSNNLYIPPDATGKNLHTYVDEEISGFVVDYTGQTAPYHERSFIHLEPTSYDLSLARAYLDYIRGVKQEGY